VIGERFLVEELAEHIARRIVERQERAAGRGADHARVSLERRTPVTKLATQEMVSLIGIAAALRERRSRASSASRRPGSTPARARRGSSAAAAERLLEAGFEDGDVERILELVPLATHNQRGRGTLLVGTERRLNAERLVEIVERSMSSPIYELLKRPDELFVVEHAHLQPRFVEDSVRVALKSVLDELPRSATRTSSSRARSTSRRSMPTRSWPSATARSASCARSSRTATTPGRAYGPQGLVARVASLAGAAARSGSLSPREPRDVRAVKEGNATPLAPPNAITGHG
jgi:GTP cyclohydrolase FolE2